MKILIVTEEGTLFIYFKSAIQALCEKGHEVHVAFAKDISENILAGITDFEKKFPNFKRQKSFYRSGAKKSIMQSLRAAANYRHFLLLHDKGWLSKFYSRRIRKYLPAWVRIFVWSEYININFLIKTNVFGNFLNWAEQSAEPDPDISVQIKEIAPDVLIACPSNIVGSTPDPDYIHAAKKLGIKTVMFVYSWDNLETKAVIYVKPDYLFAWNELQGNSAIVNHGIRPEQIKIIGAPFFDNFFAEMKQPHSSREEFCTKYNLNPAAPILLYMGSSSIYGDESWLIKIIRDALNESSDPVLRSMQIIARPHPAHIKLLKKMDTNLALVQKSESPSIKDAIRDLYDTLYHSVAVAGICTSGFIPAFIMNKPLITMVADRYDLIQQGAPHCRQLLDAKVLYVAENGEDFRKILADCLRGVDGKKQFRREFVDKYVRPKGLEKAAGEVFAEELVKLQLK